LQDGVALHNGNRILSHYVKYLGCVKLYVQFCGDISQRREHQGPQNER
jgi:hypothetical protein